MPREPLTATPVREPRPARLVRATLDHPGGRIAIVVRNLSDRGFGATCRDNPPRPGEAVRVALPGLGPCEGTVRWVAKTAFGIAFDRPVDPAVVTAALSREAERVHAATDWAPETRHRVHTPRTDPARLRRI